MNGCLIDTNAAIFAVTEPERLSEAACQAIVHGPNRVSVVSLWEVTLKSMKGSLHIGDAETWWRDALRELQADVLPLQPEHVFAIRKLSEVHKDPFDRILMAQAMVEGLDLVTSDRAMRRYVSPDLKIIW